MSIRNTSAILNNIRRRKKLKEISKSSLHRMMCSLKPMRRSILKIPKGSFDKYDKWSQARKKWSLQLAIRFGSIKWSDISTEPPPDYYDISHIGQIHKDQVVWWDETHPKCKIGAIQGRDSKVSYPRNEDGLIDIEDGTYEEHPTEMTLKHDKEIRIAFGVDRNSI